MKTLLGSIVAAAAFAGAATLVTGPGSAAGFVTARPGGSYEIEINRAAKASRWPDVQRVLVKTIRILPAERREDHPVALLLDCEPLVSPLADGVASRRPRQCTT